MFLRMSAWELGGFYPINALGVVKMVSCGWSVDGALDDKNEYGLRKVISYSTECSSCTMKLAKKKKKVPGNFKIHVT